MSATVSNKNPSSYPSAEWVSLVSCLKVLALFLSFAFLLKASVVEAFKIPSSSMEPTLQTGDHILVNKLDYGFQLPFMSVSLVNFRFPRRGDVVVFTLPDDPVTFGVDESNTNIIKRVVGLPGDIVEVRGQHLLVNHQVQNSDRRYAVWKAGGIKDFPPLRVPERRVMVLGDNRDESNDSRYWNEPFLDVSRIKGRAFIIYWNYREPLRRVFKVID